jgi:palmitoyltransferase
VIDLDLNYLQHGGDVNSADNIQQTPLHWAAVKGSIDVADLLLQHGARIEAVDVNGFRVISSFCCNFCVFVC